MTRRDEARAAEQLYALKYGIPTLPFVARPGASVNGLVHDQALIDSIFEGIDSYAHGIRLLSELASRLPRAAPRAAVLRGAASQCHADAVQ